MQVLLNQGMQAILRIARGAAGTEVWPRVHAFNVLRLAFQEAKLAVSMTGHCAEGGWALAPWSVQFRLYYMPSMP